MDSKDTSSTAMVGTVSKEDDVKVAATTRNATAAFRGGRFEECADLLNQLLQQKHEDPQVVHNIAVLGNFKDGCPDPKKLLEVLDSVKKRKEDLAQVSGDHTDSVSNIGSKAISAVKDANSLSYHFSSSSSSHIGSNDEFDTSLVMFNMAVVWFSLHEYVKAYSILDSLFKEIRPVDEATALRVCLLFLEVALRSHDPWKFLDVITYVEKSFCVSNPSGQGDHGSSTQGTPHIMTKSSSLPGSAAVTDAPSSELIATNPNASPEEPLTRTMSEESIENLISIFGQPPTRSCVQSSHDYIKILTDQFITVNDLRLKLQLFKVQYLLLTKNLKAAKREVKTAMPMNLACGRDSSVALLLKSQLEYDRGNYPKAIKLLMASSNRNEIGISIIHNNNLGCIYYRLGKYYTSSIFFSRALKSASALRKEKPLKLAAMSQDKSLEIVYNCGLQYLACGNPMSAAHCFQKASLVFHNRPLLWLRIAECCLMGLDKGLLSSGETQNDGSEVKVHVFGEGKYRHLAMETGGFNGKNDIYLGNDKQPKLSLHMAWRCLLNALYVLDNLESKPVKPSLSHSPAMEENETTEALLKNSNNKNVASGDSKASNLKVGSGQINSNGDGKEQKSGNNPNAVLLNSLADYGDIRRRENHMIRQALLADLAFVELEFGNPLKALSTAKTLLALKECSRIYIFLGNVYAAESLCLLNRPKEASEHLLAYLSSGINIEPPYNDEDCEKWRVVKTLDCEDQIIRNSSPDELQEVVLQKPEEAHGILYVNLAIACALEGNFEQARGFIIEGLSKLPDNKEAIITATFIDIAMGKTREALARLKKRSHIRFLPSILKL